MSEEAGGNVELHRSGVEKRSLSPNIATSHPCNIGQDGPFAHLWLGVLLIVSEAVVLNEKALTLVLRTFEARAVCTKC